MKITIFTSCYNQGEYLSQAIESVLNQTYQDFEYLIYDDGSTDNTREVLSEFHKKTINDRRVHITFLDKQSNVASMINKSVENMNGDIWVWLPADDILSPNLLQRKVEVSKQYKNKAVLYSGWVVIDEEGKYISKNMPKSLSPIEFAKEIFISCPIGFTGIWIPKEVLNKVGKFSEELQCSEDYEWVLKAVTIGVPFICIPELLYSKRIHSNRTTNRMAKEIPDIVVKIRKEFAQ